MNHVPASVTDVGTPKAASTPMDVRVKVWDWPLRLFHWVLVTAVAVAFFSSEEDSPLNDYHILAGWVAGILIVFRVFWGFAGGERSRFSDFVRPSQVGGHFRELLHGRPAPTLGHNALGGLSVLVLLFFVAATVWAGATIPAGTDAELHELLAWTLLALVAVHVVAVVLMSMLTRESLVSAMISGNKPARLHPGARDAWPPRALALILAMTVIAGAVLAIRSYDPRAFTLRGTESFEHGSRSDSSDEAELSDEHVAEERD